MKRFIIGISIMSIILTCIPVKVMYAQDLAETVFYDDFENGYAFWDCGNSMRISNGELISDVKESVSVATLKGETTRLENFVMDTVFKIDEIDSWFGILIRQGSAGAIHFVIHESGFYTTATPVSGSVHCGYTFENDVSYVFRIIAEGTKITVLIKKENAAEFEKEWTAEFKESGNGGIEIRSFLAKARVDSVKITETTDGKIYYPNKFLTVDAGDTISAVPEFQEGFEPSSVTYTISGDSFTVDGDGNVTAAEATAGTGLGVLTATAVVDGVEYTARCDITRTVKVESLAGMTYFSKMAVGDTQNLAVTYSPEDATNKDLIWETDNPDAIELVGDTQGAIGIRALTPAKNVRVCAKAKEDQSIKYEHYITVEGRPSEIKVSEFNFDGYKREIPYGMFGISDIPSVASVDDIKEYESTHIPLWREIKLQQFRSAIEDFDPDTGNIIGRASGFTCTAADIVNAANELDIPINLSLNAGFDSAEKIIKLAQELRNVTDKELCFGIWEECYDGRMAANEGWSVATVNDYTAFLEEIYPKVKEAFPDGSVKIGATILDHPSYVGYGNGVGTAVTNMVGTWNHYVAEAKDYYDAVVVHHYSGGAASTKGIMEGFAVDSACLVEGLEIQAEMFPGKEFWINEWGDLPMSLIFEENYQSNQARNQYMKSLGNAIGYLQRILDMTLDENVTMSAYHGYNDSQGFGTVQKDKDGLFVKLPSYYMFSTVGDLFDKHSYIYSMEYSEDSDLHYMKDMSTLRNVSEGEYVVKASLVNAWAFGDEDEAKEAVFQNSSEYSVKVYIPGYKLKKVMSFGNGENPLPDLAVNQNDKMHDAPEYIPEPEYFESEEYASFIVMEPYSVIRTELTREIDDDMWEISFEDDFSENLDNWTAGDGYILQEDGTVRLYAHNQYLAPSIPAAKNFILEFDAFGWQNSGLHVQLKNADSSKASVLIHIPNRSLDSQNIGIFAGDLFHFAAGDLYGGTVEAPIKNSVRLVLENGNLSFYAKAETASDYSLICEFKQGSGNVSSIIDDESCYIPQIYQVYNGVDFPNANETYIDNVKIKTLKTLLGTEEIKPVYETVFEDDFSGTLNSSWVVKLTGKLSDKWNITYPNNVTCSITENKELSMTGHNAYLVPQAEFSSETLEVEYDFCGPSNCMLLEFYNTEDSSDWFRVRCQEGYTYVYDKNDSIHYFGSGIEDNKWQTVKFRINDGLLDVFIKDSAEAEFNEKEHCKGRPYSYIWYNADDENVSFMKKGVKYGVKIYIFAASTQEILIDNFKIRTVPTTVGEIAQIDGVNIFEVTDINIQVKTDDGYEISANPVKGTENIFTVQSEAYSGNSVLGKAVFAVYDGDRLFDVVLSDMKEESEASVYIPHTLVNPGVKLMILEDLESGTPMTQVLQYLK